MDKELIKKWVEALRSGEYKQAKFKLRRQDQETYCHCCIGVACDLIPGFDWTWAYASSLTTAYPPEDVQDTYGINKPLTDSQILRIKATAKQQKIKLDNQPITTITDFLIIANDHFSWDFNQIANWIEINVLAD